MKKKNIVNKKINNLKNAAKDEFILNVPNSLTLLRLVLAFVFIYMLFSGFSRLSLVIIFVIAAVTDWFDGFFARKLKQTSAVGARLDQVIDRVFTISIVVALLIYDSLHYNGTHNYALLLILICSREIIGLPGFLICLVRGKDSYKVRYVGKLMTFFQSVTMAVIIAQFEWAIYLAFVTCIIGIVAGFDYLRYSFSNE